MHWLAELVKNIDNVFVFVFVRIYYKYICNGYTVCLRAISNSIVPKPRAEDEKIPRLRGYTVGYSPSKHNIYITYIYIYIYKPPPHTLQKCVGSKL